MIKVYYGDILLGTVTTNQSLTVDQALNLLEFDEKAFLTQNGFDDIDYDTFKLVY